MSGVAISWDQVMAELSGLRLALIDNLLSKGAMDYATLTNHSAAGLEPLTEAVQWLARHRLLVCEDGQWRAVHHGLARQQVEMNGLADTPNVSGTPISTTERGSVSTQRGRTPAVQRHQVEFFTQDGYREANGSRD